MQDIENPIPKENKTSMVPDDMPTPPEGVEPINIETAAEGEGDEELPSPLEDGETFGEEALAEAVKGESKVRVFFRKLLRWTVGLLIVFGLGLVTGILALYRPATQKADQETRQQQIELQDANTQILDYENQILGLEDQVASLQALQVKNDELLAAQNGFKLHIAILDARLDISRAMLALSKDDTAAARIILDKTSGTLDTITSLLAPGQQAVVTAMKQRLALVMSELEDDVYAAQSDLDVLATNLLQLEDALFTE